MGPPLNQSSLGSCGANTADELIEFDQKAEGQPVQSASRLFIYYCTRSLMGTVSQDSGVDNRTMLKALAQYGYCDESLWPYDVTKFASKPSAAAFAYAATNKITSYAAVAVNLAAMKAAIVSGFPFMFGFDVYQQIESDQAAQTGVLTMPPPGATPIGGHDVTIWGYDDARQVFNFRNHWSKNDGSPWGDNGNGTIPYAYATNPSLCSDFWAINAVPGAVTPPVPVNPPAPVPVSGNYVLRLANGVLSVDGYHLVPTTGG